VFAHYFPPYPISLDNRPAASDYYTAHYLDPAGEQGRHAAYGGLLRERPLPRPVDDSTDWELADMRTEVRRAIDAGIDGFTVNLLGLRGDDYWPTVLTLLEAAADVDPDFGIVLMPDATTDAVADPWELADAVADLAERYPALERLPDGRLVVSPFAPERIGAEWWARWVRYLAVEHDLRVALVPCFLEYGPETADAFQPFSHGFSSWGDRSPGYAAEHAGDADLAHARDRLWMQPVSLQDARPAQGVYDEANNTENLRSTWQAAIDGAEWVQLITWNDYAEGTELAPSTHIGWSPLEISAYYLTRFKTGGWPELVRDVVHVSHRVQAAGAVPSGHTGTMTLREGSSPARDEVEVLAFLTAPAAVRLTVGGQLHEFDLPAGVQVVTAPLAVGEITVAVHRDGELVAEASSPFEVLRTPRIQDLQYRFTSSSRPVDPARD
jgi:hypothetical protein